MPGIAVKYWAFQQTGWGHIDESVIPPVIDVETSRSDYQDWIGTGGGLLTDVKKLIFYVEPRTLTVISFFDYLTNQSELSIGSQEKWNFSILTKNIIENEHYPKLTIGKINNYLSVEVHESRKDTNGSIFVPDSIPLFGYDSQENIVFYNKWIDKYREGNTRLNTSLFIPTTLRERREYKVKSSAHIPLYIRNSILEYVRWRTPLAILPSEYIDDEVLLAALAQIVLDIEENGE